MEEDEPDVKRGDDSGDESDVAKKEEKDESEAKDVEAVEVRDVQYNMEKLVGMLAYVIHMCSHHNDDDKYAGH